MFALGSFNLSADLWLMARGGWSQAANPARITSEVMIIVEQTHGTRPPGRLLEHAVIDGSRYELWRAAAFGSELRGGRGWPLQSFRAPGPAPHGTLDLRTFLAHLVRAGHVRPEEHVASVELGNEIRGGAGTTFITDFDVELVT